MAYRAVSLGVCLLLCAAAEVVRAQCQGEPPRGQQWMRAIPDAVLTYFLDPSSSEWGSSAVTSMVIQAIDDWNGENTQTGLSTYYTPATQEYNGQGQIKVVWGRPKRADGTPCEPFECGGRYGPLARFSGAWLHHQVCDHLRSRGVRYNARCSRL